MEENMRKTFFAIMMILLISIQGVNFAYAQGSTSADSNQTDSKKTTAVDITPPTIDAGEAVAIDVKTGEIYYDKNANTAAYPASMTKLLTSIVVDEKVKDNEKIKISDEAMNTECECYGFKQGEELTKKDAINIMLIKSANDVAVAVADYIGGSIPGFAKIMNETAKEIGVSDKANFVTPNGLNDPNHHVTPYDMALILREAIKHPLILQALKNQSYKADTNKQTVDIPRHDTISHLKNIVGGKTGYTSAAGNTLATYFKDGDKEVIVVVMQGHPSIYYKDTQAVADYAFSQMDSKTILKRNQAVKTVEIGTTKMPLLAKDDFNLTFKIGETPNYKIETDDVTKKGDIKAGEEISKAQIFVGDKLVGEVPLLAGTDMIVSNNGDKQSNTVGGFKLGIWWAIGIPWLLYLGYFVIYNLQKRKNLKAKN